MIPPRLTRWRLMLGEPASSTCPLDGYEEHDEALRWLYDRDQPDDVDTRGGLGISQLTVPEWLDRVHTLFPRRTIERIERDAVEHYQIDEILTRPDILERVRPSVPLLRALLRTRHLQKPDLLARARVIVAAVVADLMDALRVDVQRATRGRVSHGRHGPPRLANLDLRATLRRDLGHRDPRTGQILLRRPIFRERSARQLPPWQIILLVDQSLSMAGSVIHSAVTAACLWGLPSLRTHLVVFDTAVVDLTADVVDPVELLMRVQLGGGTDIGRAMRYAADLITDPRRAIVVLISDLGEGANPAPLLSTVASLVAQGTRVLALAALDPASTPRYDTQIADLLLQRGASIGAMTPGELAGWIGEQLRR